MSLSPRRLSRGSAVVDVGAPPGNVVRVRGVFRETGGDPWLYSLLEVIHGEAQAAHLPEVVLDLRELSYANADGWRNLVLLLRLMKGPPVASYKLRMLTNMAHQWQRVGIPTLSVFGAGVLTIESTSTELEESDSVDPGPGRRSWRS